jgi:hypothetical protein
MPVPKDEFSWTVQSSGKIGNISVQRLQDVSKQPPRISEQKPPDRMVSFGEVTID